MNKYIYLLRRGVHSRFDLYRWKYHLFYVVFKSETLRDILDLMALMISSVLDEILCRVPKLVFCYCCCSYYHHSKCKKITRHIFVPPTMTFIDERFDEIQTVIKISIS